MPIGQRTPGPIHLFVRYRSRNSNSGSGGFTQLAYLGTAVTAPEPDHEKFKIPVMNDLGGRSVPFQLVQDGEQAIVFGTLNRFDYNLLQQIRALESGGTLPPVAPIGDFDGGEFPNARGTLVIGISDFQLLVYNSYASTPSAGSFVGTSDLPYARVYWSVNLRKYKESTVGTRVLEVGLAMECNNTYDNILREFDLFTEYLTLASLTSDGFPDPNTLIV